MYYGDIALGDTIDIKFTTRRFSTGAPHALAGPGVISAYPGNSTTQLTAGITTTADFDGVTGLNNVRVVATSGNGYAAGTNYALVITTGTVDSVSVVGEVIGYFSIQNRLDWLADDGTASFDRTTDSLQAIRDSSATVAAVGDEVYASTRVRLKKNVAGQTFKFSMRDSNGDAVTGLTISGANARRLIDGAAIANITGTVAESGVGVYRCSPSQADTNGDDITFVFTGTNAKQTDVHILTVP